MSRRRRRRAASRRIRATIAVVAAAGFLVGGLLVAAELFDGERLLQPQPTLEPEPGSQPPASWDRVRVEVLNAGGVAGMAARARDELRDVGFDVVYYGNAATFDREVTVVLDRTGSLEAARSVAERLGTDSVEVAPDSTRFVDVTVVLGAGWTGETVRVPDASGEEEEGRGDRGGPWWDLRRYLPSAPNDTP